MKNPIRIRTNTTNKHYYDVYLYQDEDIFDEDREELERDNEVVVKYAGETNQLSNQVGKLEQGTRVTFREEGSLGTERKGKIVRISNTPYYEVEEDFTKFRYGVHKKYIKSIEPTYRDLAEHFIEKFSDYNFRKYDLGAVKIEQKTFMTAEESLADLASKAEFIIMLQKSKK